MVERLALELPQQVEQQVLVLALVVTVVRHLHLVAQAVREPQFTQAAGVVVLVTEQQQLPVVLVACTGAVAVAARLLPFQPAVLVLLASSSSRTPQSQQPQPEICF
jgi:hypothetical protein